MVPSMIQQMLAWEFVKFSGKVYIIEWRDLPGIVNLLPDTKVPGTLGTCWIPKNEDK